MTGETRAEAIRNHAPSGSFEERGAKASLEIGQLVAERGQGEIELLPGASEGAELRDGDDEPEVANLETHG